VLDDSRQILKRIYYGKRNGTDSTGMGTITVSPATNPFTSDKYIAFYVNIPMDDNTEGMHFRWNFGDDTTHVTTINSNVVHTYPGYATYTYTVTITSPYYPAKTITGTVTTTATPDPGSSPHVTATSLDNGTGTIEAVQFYTGSTLVYSFTQAQMESGTITVPPGSYTVVVGVSGQQYNESLGTGYKRAVMYSNNTYQACAPFLGTPYHQHYSFGVNLTVSGISSLNFALDTSNCDPIP
jgi:hypothetical protein